MIKAFIALLLFTLIIACGIIGFRAMTKLEKWKLLKTFSFALVCSSIAVMVITCIVILF